MKKIIILLTTLLSLNLFGGLVHKDVDTRVKGKIGYGYHKGSKGLLILGFDVVMKSNVYKSDDVDVYFGGKLNVQDDLLIDDFNINLFNTNLIGIVGTEEKYKDIKFYQQLGLGIGYNRYSGYNQSLSIYHGLSMLTPDVEVGLIYKNVIVSLGGNLELVFLKTNKDFGQEQIVTTPAFTVSVGYEF